MAIRSSSERKPEIDISGPGGNAYALLGTAGDLAKELGKNRVKIIEKMKSGDYENLIKVFDEEFGAYVDLIR